MLARIAKYAIHLPKFKNQNNKQEMKKVLTLVAVAGMFTFIACGPSAEEKEKAEKAKQDSIRAAHEADSIAAAQAAEAAAQAAAAQAAADSAAKAQAAADSIAAAEGSKKK